MTRIRMLKSYGDSVLPALELIFKSCLESGRFPSEWVKKKSDKQSLKNYRPTSFFPICGKIFEWLTYNKMFEYFIENDLISHNQSRFKRGEIFINQLLSNEICKSLDEGYETRSVFLDISKV